MRIGPFLYDQPVYKPLSDFRFRRLGHTLKATFQSWYPGLFNAVNRNQEIEKAAA